MRGKGRTQQLRGGLDIHTCAQAMHVLTPPSCPVPHAVTSALPKIMSKGPTISIQKGDKVPIPSLSPQDKRCKPGQTQMLGSSFQITDRPGNIQTPTMSQVPNLAEQCNEAKLVGQNAATNQEAVVGSCPQGIHSVTMAKQ